MQNNQAIYNMVISIDKIALQDTVGETASEQAYSTTIKELKGMYRIYIGNIRLNT
jgi:hypothetical protein